MNIHEIEINQIRYNNRRRIRDDLGDLSGLKDSISKHGLFYPIIVTPDYELLAGQRRLESIKQLGWTKVPALILYPREELDRFEIEVEENIVRKEFTLEEVEKMLKKKRELMKMGFWHKLWRKIKRFFQWIGGLFSRS
jgi:ParB family chromosome partitioning protein